MDKRTLCRRISAVSFALWETTLYLDTHPDCAEALAKRQALLAERAGLIALYESHFGAFVLTSDQAPCEGRWTWIDDPWPWDNTEGGCC